MGVTKAETLQESMEIKYNLHTHLKLRYCKELAVKQIIKRII